MLSAQRCGEHDFVGRPNLACHGQSCAVTWRAQGRSDRSVVYAYTFEAQGSADELHTIDKRKLSPILAGHGMFSSPQIAVTDSGYLVMTERKYGERVHDVEIALQRLDDQGRPLYEVDVIRDHELCDSPVRGGDQIVVGAVHVAKSGKFPHDMLTFLAFDSDGAFRSSTGQTFNYTRACATAANNKYVALARIAYEGEIDLFFLSLREDVPNPKHRRLPIIAGRGLRIVSYLDDWAVLYSDNEKRLWVALVNTEWGLYEKVLVSDVEASSADLGVTHHGLVVTWTSNGKVHLRPVAQNKAPRSFRAGRDPSGTAVMGHGNRCLIAWTSAQGARAQLLQVDECAGPHSTGPHQRKMSVPSVSWPSSAGISPLMPSRT